MPECEKHGTYGQPLTSTLEMRYGPCPQCEHEKLDWRSRTCGECGWAMCWQYNGGDWFQCRRENWQDVDDIRMLQQSIPACPAFVARESATHAASIAAGKE